MDLRHLQALVGIADCGSFSAAAEAIGTVQSNVSAHVARLERELDATLVDRSSGRLTEEGEVVVARARRMMGELDAMVADVVGHSPGGGGHGPSRDDRHYRPLARAPALRPVRERHPQVHLNVSDGTNTTLEPQLVSEQLDLAVLTMPVPSEELSAVPALRRGPGSGGCGGAPARFGHHDRRCRRDAGEPGPAAALGARRSRAAPAAPGHRAQSGDRRHRAARRRPTAPVHRARRGADDRLAHL